MWLVKSKSVISESKIVKSKNIQYHKKMFCVTGLLNFYVSCYKVSLLNGLHYFLMERFCSLSTLE